MAGTQAAYIKWGKSRVTIRIECYKALKRLPSDVYQLLWESVTQGKGNSVQASGNTHSDGYALDFSFKRPRKWTNSLLHRVCAELVKVGFAVAPRYQGELNPDNPAHLHIALVPHSNSKAIINAQRVGRSLAARINRAIPQIGLV